MRDSKFSHWFKPITLLTAWTALWWLPWQPWLAGLPWLGFVFGISLFLIPGILLGSLIQPEKRNHLAYQLTTGFAISITITGILGLAARLSQLSFTFVSIGFYFVGAILIFCWTRKKELSTSSKFSRPDFWYFALLIIAVAATFLAAKTAIPARAYGDDFTYNAQVNYFLNAPAYTFKFDEALSRMEIARFWLAFWPLAEALIADLSGLHPLLITGIYIAPALVIFSALALYSLARGLGFAPKVALLVITGQFFSLFRLTSLDQPGRIFFDRLAEDKVAAAFVLALVVFQLVVAFLEKPTKNRLALLALAGIGLMFVHPVIMGMVALISGLYGLITLGAQCNFKPFLQIVAVLALITLLPFALRFTEGQKLFTFTVEEAKAVGLEDKITSGRLQILENDRFYGISPDLINGLPYKLSFAAGILSLFLIKKSKSARYILASLLALGLFTFPYTGWIFGFAMTPYQLWRLTWLMPFGIAIAILIQTGLDLLIKINWLQKYADILQNGLLLASQIILLAGMLYLLPWAQGNLAFGVQKPATPFWYEDYIEIGDFIQRQVNPGAVIVGGPDRATNDLIPSMALNVNLISFRNENGGRNASLWEAIVGEDTPSDERYALLLENNVNYLLIREEPAWMDALIDRYPSQFEVIFENRKLRLYQISFGAEQ